MKVYIYARKYSETDKPVLAVSNWADWASWDKAGGCNILLGEREIDMAEFKAMDLEALFEKAEA